MKSYTINNKKFFTICNVHDEINGIAYRLQKKTFLKKLNKS